MTGLEEEFLKFFRKQWLTDVAEFPRADGQVASGWACPEGCCAICVESDGGVLCPVCGQKFAWAVLAGTDD